MPIMNALSTLFKELSVLSIPTSSRKLDEALGNGVRLELITEIAGREGTGKTQLILQMIFNTVLPKPLGVINGEAVYISTRPANFCPDRIYPMVDRQVEVWREKFANTPEAIVFSRDVALGKIHFIGVNSIANLIQTVYNLDKFLKSNSSNVSYLIFIMFFMIFHCDCFHSRFGLLQSILIPCCSEASYQWNKFELTTNYCQCWKLSQSNTVVL